VDVVWREKKVNYSSLNDDHAVPTLRRERFSFDSLFGGPEASLKLDNFIRKRVRYSLLSGRGFAILNVAAGDSHTNITSLEPPLSALVGECGGRGVISIAIDEIFKVKSRGAAQSSNRSNSHQLYASSLTMRSQSPNTISSLSNNFVTFSATVFTDGVAIDLLGAPVKPNSKSRHGSSKKSVTCSVSRRSDGRYCIANASRLQLKSASDFERVAGVLLGRRSVMRELTPIFLKTCAADEAMTYGDLFLPDAPWLLIPETEACVLFTLTTIKEGVSASSHSEISFHFTSPIGDQWAIPGTELCLLAEALSGLPNYPPPSLFNAGSLTKLLVVKCI
jgi:hypothetical protein